MKKHNFKIGDKVKLINPSQWNMFDTDIGVIVNFEDYIRVAWGKESNLGNGILKTGYPHLAKEIEKIYIKGEQLLFQFMLED